MGIGIGIGIGNIMGYGTKIMGGGNNDCCMFNGYSGGGRSLVGVLLPVVVWDCVNAGDPHCSGARGGN